MLITKSKFVAGVQCLKRLYLTVHTPELAAQPDESDQSIIDQGREVGLLARQMLPGGVVVECKDREQAIRMTRELIENPDGLFSILALNDYTARKHLPCQKT